METAFSRKSNNRTAAADDLALETRNENADQEKVTAETYFYDKIQAMIASETIIDSAIARRILYEADQNGVSVEEYLKKIAEENPAGGERGNSEVRRTETGFDFSREQEWLRKNRQKFIGRWIVLDGNRLVGAADDPKEIVEKARSEGVKIPFVKFITDDSEPFSGGWS